MIRNMNSTFGLIFSQRAMLTLIEKGMTREQAYDLVATGKRLTLGTTK